LFFLFLFLFPFSFSFSFSFTFVFCMLHCSWSDWVRLKPKCPMSRFDPIKLKNPKKILRYCVLFEKLVFNTIQ
jgi:hypothetical protein